MSLKLEKRLGDERRASLKHGQSNITLRKNPISRNFFNSLFFILKKVENQICANLF
jgi:hypothetical protein